MFNMNLNNGIYKYAIIVIICVFNMNFIQGQGISSTNSNVIEKHTGLPSNAFYNQQNSPTGYDPGDTNVITIEAENLVLTSAIINSLNQGGSYYQFEGLAVGEVVNVYLFYLNHDGSNFRSSPGIVTFDNVIKGIYLEHDQFKHFTGSNFSSSNYDSSPPSGMRFEPTSFNNGNWHSSWNDSSADDWFLRYGGGKIFKAGLKNGLKGDFFRIVTRGMYRSNSQCRIKCHN